MGATQSDLIARQNGINTERRISSSCCLAAFNCWLGLVPPWFPTRHFEDFHSLSRVSAVFGRFRALQYSRMAEVIASWFFKEGEDAADELQACFGRLPSRAGLLFCGPGLELSFLFLSGILGCIKRNLRVVKKFKIINPTSNEFGCRFTRALPFF